jgi:hypothetical protein
MMALVIIGAMAASTTVTLTSKPRIPRHTTNKSAIKAGPKIIFKEKTDRQGARLAFQRLPAK